MNRSRAMCYVLVMMCLWLPTGAAPAAPTGADLLEACREALAGGFADVAGQMCTWYVTPCDCETVRKAGAPRVCLPGEADVESLAQAVVTGLRSQPGLQSQDADVAAAVILSRIHPCPE